MATQGTAIDIRAAILAEILKCPDDDALRQAFASSLPADDPRRVFIEAQLTLHRLRHQSYTDEYFQASLHSKRLLYLHYHEWRPYWRGEINSSVEEYEFYRGFVELVQISGQAFLKAGPELFQAAPIRHLDFVGTSGLWNQLANQGTLSSILSLSLKSNKLTDEDIQALAASNFLGNLRWLSLVNNRQLSQQGIRALAENYKTNLPKLQFVNFVSAGFDPSESYAYDGDLITEVRLPQTGQELEKEYGHLPWLHIRTKMRSDIPPHRFAPEDLDQETASPLSSNNLALTPVSHPELP